MGVDGWEEKGAAKQREWRKSSFCRGGPIDDFVSRLSRSHLRSAVRESATTHRPRITACSRGSGSRFDRSSHQAHVQPFMHCIPLHLSNLSRCRCLHLDHQTMLQSSSRIPLVTHCQAPEMPLSDWLHPAAMARKWLSDTKRPFSPNHSRCSTALYPATCNMRDQFCTCGMHNGHVYQYLFPKRF